MKFPSSSSISSSSSSSSSSSNNSSSSRYSSRSGQAILAEYDASDVHDIFNIKLIAWIEASPCHGNSC